MYVWHYVGLLHIQCKYFVAFKITNYSGYFKVLFEETCHTWPTKTYDLLKYHIYVQMYVKPRLFLWNTKIFYVCLESL